MTPFQDRTKKKISVAIISHLFPTHLNHVQGKFIKDQLELLQEKTGVETHLIVPTPYSLLFTKRKKKNSANLLIQNISSKRILYLSFPGKRFPVISTKTLGSKISRHLKSLPIDIVHIHWLYPDGFCIPELKKRNYKTILTIHGSDWYKNISIPDLKPFIKDTFDAADRILLSGPQLLFDIKSKFPQHESKLFDIGNFVDESIYTIPSLEEKHSAQNELGWDLSKKHFLCVASPRKEKGVDLLVQASKKLNSSIDNIHIHLVGAADSESIALDLSADYLLNHPPVSPSELVKFYHAADAYISPSRKEGFGLAMVEAAATGLPVVATQTGIAPKFIDNSIGVLCDEVSDDSIAAAMINLYHNLENYSKQEIRNKVVSMFGKEIYKEKLIQHYRELIN